LGQVIKGVESMEIIDQATTDKFDEPLKEYYIEKAYIR
jgi:hypothetical protein